MGRYAEVKTSTTNTDHDNTNSDRVSRALNLSVKKKSKGSIVFLEGCSIAVHPDARNKIFWDSLSIVILLLDMCLLPYFFAWSIGTDFVLAKITAYIACIFWTLDIPLNFVTGFYNKEAEVER